MKTNLTNMFRGKERKKRKNRYARLNRGRWRTFIYIKDLTARGKEQERQTKE